MMISLFPKHKRQKKGYKQELFHVLLAGTIGICLLTVALFLVYFLFRTGFLFDHNALERDAVKYVTRAQTVFSQMLCQYEEALKEMATDKALLEKIRAEGISDSSDMYRLLYGRLHQAGIDSVAHLVSREGDQVVSTGYKLSPFDGSCYAGIPMILKHNSGTLIHTKRFENTSKETVVLVMAHELILEGELLGYVYFDIADTKIEALLASDPELRVDGQEAYVYYIVYNWYNYVVYDKSSLGGIRQGTNYMQGEFADRFKTGQPTVEIYESNGTKYLLSGSLDASGQFVVLCAISMNLLQKSNQQMIVATLVISTVMLLICFLFARKIQISFIGPIRNIIHTMEQFGKGDMTARCEFVANNELAMIRDQLNQMILEVDQAFQNAREKQERLLLAEDNFLKAQIKPHFINNVLESIHWMMKMGEVDAASVALRNLGKMMTKRMNYYASSQESFQESLDFTSQYIAIQRLCYLDRIDVEMEIGPDTLGILVPTFLLQPVVENAIIHGLEPKVGQGILKILARREGEELLIQVVDDGVGIGEDAKKNLLHREKKGQGIGLYNVHRRLQLAYGESYGLQIQSVLGKGTKIKMRIPVSKEEAGTEEQEDY
ncbi:MAG: sensor histidine kinase [Lachnospiraceae bacterium]|nr:sensor histidine kinase [Lachnospiraceae bacterium]